MKFLKKISGLTLGFRKSKQTTNPSTPINMTGNTNIPTLSPIASHRIEDLFDDFCIYIAKRYDAGYDDAICDWNCVGATFRYFGRDIHIQLKVWKRSLGHNNLPDDIIVLSDFVTGSGHAQDKDEFVALCDFIFKRGARHGFKHLAVETPEVIFIKEVTVPSTHIPCMKFA